MKNLQSFGVLEMNAEEMENINGGSLWGRIIAAAIFIVAGMLIASNNNNVQF